MTDQPAPAEHCGEIKPSIIGTSRTECVLRPGHFGSHADENGTRWYALRDPAPAPDAGLREQMGLALAEKFTAPSRDDQPAAERLDQGMMHHFIAEDGYGSMAPVTPRQVAEVCDAVRDREIKQLRERLRKAERAADLLADSHRRAEQAEDLLRIAHDTSNKSEAERARAVQRAEYAEVHALIHDQQQETAR